jgi:spermidine synthase
MKVVYPICCGVDVHKTFFVATLITSQGIIPHYKKERFSTFNNSILKFKQWLIDNNCFDVCMESTGKYWIPVYNLLEDTIRVTVANPKWVKAVKGNKDDTKDSKWIGDLFRLGLVPGSFIPDKPIRILREYTRYRYKLVSCKSSEKNRFQNAFTVCNVALDSVVSDMFGKSASSITDYLISSDSFDPEHCSSLLKGSLKKKADDVVESIEGYQMTQEQKERMIMVRSHPAFATNPEIKNVLIIGGGDGGTAREVSRYSTVEKIDMVEIDERVVRLCMQYLPQTSCVLEKDMRINLFFEDGVKFVKNARDGSYDLILVDSTDPIGPGEGLFTSEFYKDCYRILTENGILINQHESPYYDNDTREMRKAHWKIKNIFPIAKVYEFHIPTYPSGHWLFGFASKSLDPVDDFKPEEWKKFNLKTKYYNIELHKASFALPTYVKELLEN